MKVFDPIGFADLVRSVSLSSVVAEDIRFTAEAMDCIQSYTEAYLVDLFENANSVALNSDRKIITIADIESVRFIKRERP